MYSKNLKTFLKRRMAFLLSVIMIITLMPVNAFAADVAAKTVVKINTEVAATKDVAFGTAQDALGLPTKLSVQVKNADSEETTEEEADISWNGTYDQNQAGSYTLTAAFGEAYVYEGTMPSITVNVAEQVQENQSEAPAGNSTPAETPESNDDPAAIPAPVSEPEDNQDPDAGVMPLALEEIDLKDNISS